jgi:hypothetical protein
VVTPKPEPSAPDETSEELVPQQAKPPTEAEKMWAWLRGDFGKAFDPDKKE